MRRSRRADGIVGTYRANAAAAWLRLGNGNEAKRLVRDEMAQARPQSVRVRGLSLTLLAKTTSAKRRPQLLAEAAGLFENCGARYELACALHDLSKAHQALGKPRLARQVARRAWHLAQKCGAEPLYSDLFPQSGQPDPALRQPRPSVAAQSLTSSERRVASLAAAGYTNRQIAGKLFITTSTVEQHLTRVFRKLDVKRRKDLPIDL